MLGLQLCRTFLLQVLHSYLIWVVVVLAATDASATEIADNLWQRWKGDDDLISYKEFRQNLKRLHIRVGKIKLRRLLRVIDPDQSGRHLQSLKWLLIPKL